MPTAESRGKVKTLGEALYQLLSSWGVDGKVREQRAVCCWEQIVGPRIAAHTEALRVENGRVYIRARSSSWKTELVFMKGDIIDRLNQAVGKRVITDIIFVGSGNGAVSTFDKQRKD
jgi:predicted nucleic acid-binding Zn ribbon protein